MNTFKKFLLVILVTHFTISSFAKGDKGIESIPEFHIKNRKVDASLMNGTTKIKFSFLVDSKPAIGNIAIGFNDSSLYIRTNKNGEITNTIESGKYVMYFYLEGYNEVITDTVEVKSQELIEAEINFTLAGVIITVDKPVIYVYPEKEQQINIQLNVNGDLAFTYPTYNNGWSFTASPNGNIEMGGKDYNYLFWDSKMEANKLLPKNTEGFLVSSDTLLSFLENSLNQMGLNSKESADFITYWYPRMSVNEKNYIHFLFNEACNSYAELNITPKPDHVFRVGMLWSKTNSDVVPTSQTFEKMNRKGFSVIEWGGTEVTSLLNIY